MALFRSRRLSLYFIVASILFFGWNIYLYSAQSCEMQSTQIKLDYEEKLRNQAMDFQDRHRAEHQKVVDELDRLKNLLKEQKQNALDDKVFTDRKSVNSNHNENNAQRTLSQRLSVAPTPKRNTTIPILIFAHARPAYLKQCLDVLFSYHPGHDFPVYVSQDGDDAGLLQLLESYPHPLTVIRSVDTSPYKLKPGESTAYHAIARHYKNGLRNLFSKTSYDRVIILEEDLEIAPDFFDYFTKMSLLLDIDSTVMCISAWNDNGLSLNAIDPNRFYRSDFFPGLGWMMKRTLWDELGPKWPEGYWDDWLREPVQRKNRACIRPEISRTFTFGREGSSKGQYFESHLKNIQLNKEKIDYTKIDLHSFEKAAYDARMDQELLASEEVSIHQYKAGTYPKDKSIKIMISGTDWRVGGLERVFQVMIDEKAGVRRTEYRKVVTVRSPQKTIIHLISS